MGSRLSARRALISLVLVGGLTGCGDEPAEQTPTPTMAAATETSPAPEPSPTPTPLATSVPLPVMPPEMANNDAAGAEAAARYFVALADYSLATLDGSQWDALTEDDCVFCDGILDSIEEAQEDGSDRRGGRLSIVSIVGVEYRDQTDLYLVEALVAQEPYSWNRDGEIIEEGPGSEGSVSFALRFVDGSWRLIAAGTTEG